MMRIIDTISQGVVKKLQNVNYREKKVSTPYWFLYVRKADHITTSFLGNSPLIFSWPFGRVIARLVVSQNVNSRWPKI